MVERAATARAAGVVQADLANDLSIAHCNFYYITKVCSAAQRCSVVGNGAVLLATV